MSNASLRFLRTAIAAQYRLSVGMAWGIETVVDEELEDHDTVYLEGGDHQRLLRMARDQFCALMKKARHGNFSKSPLH